MTSTSWRWRVAALGAAVLAVAGCAGPEGNSVEQRLRADVAAIHALGISGVQARVITPDGEAVATAGTADRTTGAPVSADGYFRMASTVKTMVATVVLQLAAEGTLSIDDPVGRWLPETLRDSGSAITIRHLLQHTSGLRDDLPGYTTPAEYLEQRYDQHGTEQLVARTLTNAPASAPGAAWAYSNTGYLLLDLIIERATGRPGHQAIDERVVGPLGLDDTRWTGTSPTLPAPHARSYEFFGPDAEIDVTEQVPLGHALSWVTTTRDQNDFFRALLDGRLLAPAELAEMKRGVPVSPDLEPMWPGGRYGLGLLERPLSCGGGYWSHEGGDGGYITLNGVTSDGARSAVVSMSEALGDTPEHILEQERTAAALIDHALCPGGS
ncbi:serine hydrolase domain-containing protein [Nocardia neocaledoniensis]|uniref:serine hydrolase domain-containing protein n=1 Tax=Nocardia neocaledoniensis TaxID=236511 RepID=UPI000D719AA7|nr:serine hydrolase domain-containing protein [Nocardia neocaledoniensis]